MIGATLIGVLGIVLAAPMVATLRLGLRYIRGKLLDEEVFPMVSHPATRRTGLAYSLILLFPGEAFSGRERRGGAGAQPPVGRIRDKSPAEWSLGGRKGQAHGRFSSTLAARSAG